MPPFGLSSYKKCLTRNLILKAKEPISVEIATSSVAQFAIVMITPYGFVVSFVVGSVCNVTIVAVNTAFSCASTPICSRNAFSTSSISMSIYLPSNFNKRLFKSWIAGINATPIRS